MPGAPGCGLQPARGGAFEGHIEEHRAYLRAHIFQLSLFDDGEIFKQLTDRARSKMEDVLQQVFRIRDVMVDESEGGKHLMDDGSVPSIKGGEAQMAISVAEACAAAGRNSETMRKDVDEEVLVPLVCATAKEVMGDFKARLKDALIGGTIVCVEGGPMRRPRFARLSRLGVLVHSCAR